MSKYVDMYGAISFPSSNELIDEFMAELPGSPPAKHLEDDCPLWVAGDTIMCRTEWLAWTISKIIDRMCGGQVSHIGYYDPEEDERSGEMDQMTGWWYVDFD